MKLIKGALIGGVIGIAAPVVLAIANESIFIQKRLDEGAKIYDTVQICAFERRWFPLYPKVINAPGCKNNTFGMLPGIIAATAIGGGIAGGAVSILFKGKKTGNTKRKKTKITYSTSVDTTIDTKPELPVKPVEPISPVVAEKVIETPPPVEEKQVVDRQNYQRVEKDAEPKSYASNRSIEEIDDDWDRIPPQDDYEFVSQQDYSEFDQDEYMVDGRKLRMERRDEDYEGEGRSRQGPVRRRGIYQPEAERNHLDPDFNAGNIAKSIIKTGVFVIGVAVVVIGGGSLLMNSGSNSGPNSGSRFGSSNKGFCQKTTSGHTICIKEENISCAEEESSSGKYTLCKASGTSEDLTGKEEHWTSYLRRQGYNASANHVCGVRSSNITCTAARHFGKYIY